jgi:hypothetical protein
MIYELIDYKKLAPDFATEYIVCKDCGEQPDYINLDAPLSECFICLVCLNNTMRERASRKD